MQMQSTIATIFSKRFVGFDAAKSITIAHIANLQSTT